MCDATRWWCGPASVISNGSHLIIMLLIEVCHLLLLVENYVTQMRNECGRCKWMWWRWKSFRRRLSDSILAASIQAYTTHHTRFAHMSQMTPCKRCHSHIRQSIPSSNYKWMCGCRAWPFAPQFQNYTKSFVRDAPSDELTSSTMVKEMHFFNRFSSRSPSIFFLSLSSSAFKNALENVLAECAINILYIFHHFYCVCSLFVFIVHPSPLFLPFVVSNVDPLAMHWHWHWHTKDRITSEAYEKNKSYKCVEKKRRLHCARFKLPQNDMQSARESYRDGTRVWEVVVCISAGGADNRHTALRAHILCSLLNAHENPSPLCWRNPWQRACGWCSMHSFCRFVVCSSMSYLA